MLSVEHCRSAGARQTVFRCCYAEENHRWTQMDTDKKDFRNEDCVSGPWFGFDRVLGLMTINACVW